MKTIGLLGGMSWESTTSYYQAINRGVQQVLGGLHSAKICLYSVDFAPIEQLQHKGDWEGTASILAHAARSVEAGGADFFLICTNTMHRVAPAVEQAVTIPLLHIADATANHLQADRISRVGLLGTAFTMEQDFYRGRLENRYGIEVLIPEQSERDLVHRVIYDELCLGQVNGDSRQQYLDIIASLHDRGAQAVILGCTEIALLVKQQDTTVPLYDTTALHAAAAVSQALSDQ
jgi:aspartate racemase